MIVYDLKKNYIYIYIRSAAKNVITSTAYTIRQKAVSTKANAIS